MDCSEVRAIGKEVPDEAVRILFHDAFPRMVGRGKEDLGVQNVGDLSVPGELFAVVVGSGVDVVVQRFQALHRGAVRSFGHRTRQFRDGGNQGFPLDMGKQRSLVLCADNGGAFPVAEQGLSIHNGRPLGDVNSIRPRCPVFRASSRVIVSWLNPKALPISACVFQPSARCEFGIGLRR